METTGNNFAKFSHHVATRERIEVACVVNRYYQLGHHDSIDISDMVLPDRPVNPNEFKEILASCVHAQLNLTLHIPYILGDGGMPSKYVNLGGYPGTHDSDDTAFEQAYDLIRETIRKARDDVSAIPEATARHASREATRQGNIRPRHASGTFDGHEAVREDKEAFSDVLKAIVKYYRLEAWEHQEIRVDFVIGDLYKITVVRRQSDVWSTSSFLSGCYDPHAMEKIYYIDTDALEASAIDAVSTHYGLHSAILTQYIKSNRDSIASGVRRLKMAGENTYRAKHLFTDEVAFHTFARHKGMHLDLTIANAICAVLKEIYGNDFPHVSGSEEKSFFACLRVDDQIAITFLVTMTSEKNYLDMKYAQVVHDVGKVF